MADSAARDGAGFLTTASAPIATGGYVLSSEPLGLLGDGASSTSPSAALGTVRVRATPAPGRTVFVGIAPRVAVEPYLVGVAGGTITGLVDRGVVQVRDRAGAAPAVAPQAAPIWVAQSSGPGPREITWTPQPGEWTVVVASDPPALDTRATVDVGATVPGLRTWALSLLAGAAALIVVGTAVILLGVGTAHRHRRRQEQPPPGLPDRGRPPSPDQKESP